MDNKGPAFSITLFCENPSSTASCIGLCPNPDVGGVYAIIAYLVQSLATTVSILWLRHPRDRRSAFCIQFFTSLSLVVSAIYFGKKRTINSYHALLVTYIVQGTVLNAVISLSTQLFLGPFTATLFHLLIWPFIGLLAWLSVLVRDPLFGSQVQCNHTVPSNYRDFVSYLGIYIVLLLPAIGSVRSLLFRAFAAKLLTSDDGKRTAFIHTVMSIFALPFYGYWMFSTYTLIITQTNILGRSELSLTQGQMAVLALAFLSMIPLLKLIGDVARYHLTPSGGSHHSLEQEEADIKHLTHPLTGLPLHSVYVVEEFIPTSPQPNPSQLWNRRASIDDYKTAMVTAEEHDLCHHERDDAQPIDQDAPLLVDRAVSKNRQSRIYRQHSSISHAKQSEEQSSSSVTLNHQSLDDFADSKTSSISLPADIRRVPSKPIETALGSGRPSSTAVRHVTPYRRTSGLANGRTAILPHMVPELSSTFNPTRRGARGDPVSPSRTSVVSLDDRL